MTARAERRGEGAGVWLRRELWGGTTPERSQSLPGSPAKVLRPPPKPLPCEGTGPGADTTPDDPDRAAADSTTGGRTELHAGAWEAHVDPGSGPGMTSTAGMTVRPG